MLLNKPNINQTQSIYRAGIYVRLSREDENKKEFSESIINQKEFLTRFSRDNNFKIIDYYCDDGISRNNI